MRICGGLFFDLCFVSLFSAQRTHQWIARFSGTVFVTGSVTRPTTDIYIAIIKYFPMAYNSGCCIIRRRLFQALIFRLQLRSIPLMMVMLPIGALVRNNPVSNFV